MPYQTTPLKIANTFIAKYGSETGLEHLKIQKLVYYVYGWWLFNSESPVTDEAPQVWRYGPVFKSLYNAFKTYGSKPIKTIQGANPFADPETEHTPDINATIDWVWMRYGHLSAGQLSDMTHKVGTPWQIEASKNDYKVPLNYNIDPELIKTCFRAENGTTQ
jgi:uncharacterized phage-associated protein